MSVLDLRAALGGAGCREVSYEDWTASDPLRRGLLLAGHESLFYVHDDEPAAAAPVRELPTRPGSVILARVIRSRPRVPALLAGELWRHVDAAGCLCSDTAREVDLAYDWLPARVVPDDEDGPVAALHRIAHGEFDRKTSPEDIIDEHREVAARALARLDGGDGHA